MTHTTLPPREELSLKHSGRKPEGKVRGIYRVTLTGRSFVTLHSGPFGCHAAGQCLATRLFPLPPKPIREWLAERRRDGHVAHAQTALSVLNANLFSNVPRATSLPHVQNGPIVYVFADSGVALLFKLTFWGMFSG